jgi:hypothetical protein
MASKPVNRTRASRWCGARSGLRAPVTGNVSRRISPEFREFVTPSPPRAFRRRAVELIGNQDESGIAVVRRAYRRAKGAVDSQWGDIKNLEGQVEEMVRKAYKIAADVHREIVNSTPPPAIDWALRS